MEIPVYLQVLFPAEDNVIDPGIGMQQFFGVKNDIFISIFQKIRQHRSQCMVIPHLRNGFPVEIKMR